MNNQIGMAQSGSFMSFHQFFMFLKIFFNCCLFDLQIKKSIIGEEFKPNCALVIVDFMFRHGLITPDNGMYTQLRHKREMSSWV
jgi:hypothetical protein